MKHYSNLQKRPNPSIMILFLLLSLASDAAYWTQTAPTVSAAALFHSIPLCLPPLKDTQTVLVLAKHRADSSCFPRMYFLFVPD